MKTSFPFGTVRYDQDIADSIEHSITTRQIADKYRTDAAAIRLRAKALGLPLYRRSVANWQELAVELHKEGFNCHEIGPKVHRSHLTVREYLRLQGLIDEEAAARSTHKPKAAVVEIGKNSETFLDLPSDLPWPASVLRLPIRTPDESLVPCLLVQNGKVLRRFSDMIGAFQAQKNLSGESQVVRKSDGVSLRNKVTRKHPKMKGCPNGYC